MTPEGDAPLAQVSNWIEHARSVGQEPAGLMALCTVAGDGAPSVRNIPVRFVDGSGLWFHTDLASEKGVDLRQRPDKVAGLLSWPALGREVRVRGTARLSSDHEADLAFAERTHAEQLWSWVVTRPGALSGPAELAERQRSVEARFGADPVPRPATWHVVCLQPHLVEFYSVAPHRLHERRRVELVSGVWRSVHLVP